MVRFINRKVGIALGASALVMVAILLVLWTRCGLKGCPDVDTLKGYMPDEASTIVDRDGKEVGKLFVTRRVVVPLDSLPKTVPDAFVAIEDRRFWQHGGVDWRRVIGALVRNVKAGGIEEGSSTITMQLARNVFPEKLPASQKTVWRKLGEARVATAIEGEYSKKEILELYLNQIYFGNGAYGIEAAAQEYYGKSAAKLGLAESATLAALPRAPSRLNPRSNPQAALEGRRLVLDRMVAQDLISESEATAAKEQRVRLRQGKLNDREFAPYFVEAVRRLLEDELGDAVYSEGYTIHTTLDREAQVVAEEEVQRQLAAIEKGQYGRLRHATYGSFHADSTRDPEDGTPYLQAAVIIMQPQTGDVLALIGGRDYEDSQYNRATQAKRQPGSAFKPFVYAAAIEAGFPPSYRLADKPLRFVLDDGKVWEPQNYDGSYSGAVSMRDALTHSKNIPTIRLANEVGVNRVVGMAEQMGVGERIPTNPSVVLGTAEVSPLDLTAAFAAFATLGQRPEPRLVTRVVDRNGGTVWSQEPSVRKVLDPAVAFITTNMLEDVVNRGTGSAVRAVGFSGIAAGKTGTTQDAADVWYVGFTPQIVGTIWVGFDKRKTVLRGATGGELAAPVWGRIMVRIAPRSADWAPPAGIETRWVDPLGGVVAQGCPTQGQPRQEYFLTGSAPGGDCYPDMYAQIDTFGVDSMPPSYETETLEQEAGWWARLRDRVLRRDPTMPSAVVYDTAPAIEADTAPAKPAGPKILGRPVDSSGRPVEPPRAEPARPVPTDTARPTPPDTSGVSGP